MRVLILGATGRTGKHVLKEALEKGYQVNCLSRNTSRIARQEGLTIFEGDPTNTEDLAKATAACDYVISVLNISRTSDFPWARIRTPKTFLSDVMNLLIQISKKHTLKHISICSAWGVSESKKDIPKWFKWFIDNSNIGIAYQDHERQENLLAESKVDWTIVRPVGLSNSKREERIKESFANSPKPNMLISRQSVAQYLVDSLENTSLNRKKVVISKA